MFNLFFRNSCFQESSLIDVEYILGGKNSTR